MSTPLPHAPMDELPATVSMRMPAHESGLGVGQRIDDYLLVEELGRGGMGVVYKAHQLSLKRTVALKMIRQAQASVEDFARFRAEAESVARLQHPHLVGIHEVVLDRPTPYFVMEYLPGGSLAQRLDRRAVPARTAAKLLLALARAIDYAHSRGVVHRDLKPGNILLSDAGAALDEVVAKIGDFGIAKSLHDGAKLTQTGQILGTPHYMAPEQAAGKTDIGPAVDVYSLGAILYELLTGHTPFTARDATATLLRVLNEDPRSPRTLNEALPRDLETICLKCLEKNPAKRFASAGDLADDLERFLRHEPIHARQATPLERLGKWSRRHPGMATGLLAGALLAIFTIVALSLFLRQAVRQAAVESELVRTKEQNLVEVRTLLADALLERGIGLAEKSDIRRGLHWMLRSLEITEEMKDKSPRAPAIAAAARYNLNYWGQFAHPPDVPLPHGDWAWAVGFSPDGRFAVTGSADRHVRIWEVATGRMVGAPLAHTGRVWAVLWHPSGEYLFTGSGDGEVGAVRVYQAKEPGKFEPVGEPFTVPGRCVALTLQLAGELLIARHEEIKPGQKQGVYGTTLLRFNPQAAPLLRAEPALSVEHATDAVFTPKGDRLFAADSGSRIVAVDPRTGMQEGDAWQLPHPAVHLAVSGDGRHLLAACFDAANERTSLHHWDLVRDEKRAAILQAVGKARALQFAPDHRTFALSVAQKVQARFECSVRIAKISTEGLLAHELIEPLVHPLPVWSVAFCSDELLLTGCQDGFARLWNVVTGSNIVQPLKHDGNVVNVAVSPDRRHVLTASAGGNFSAQARLWELPEAQARFRAIPNRSPVATWMWPAAGRHFFIRDDLGIRRVDSETLVADIEIPGSSRRDFYHPLGVFELDQGGHFRVFDPATLKVVFELTDISLDFSDILSMALGEHVVVYSATDQELRLYHVSDGSRPAQRLKVPRPDSYSIDPVGKRMATCSPGVRDGKRGAEIVVWDRQLEPVRRWWFELTPGQCRPFLYGDILCTIGENQVSLFSIATGAPLQSPLVADGRIDHFARHPTDDLLVTATASGEVRLWHLPSGKTVGRALSLGELSRETRFNPQGTLLIAPGHTRRTFLVDHLGPKTGELADIKRWVERRTGLTLDEREHLVSVEK